MSEGLWLVEVEKYVDDAVISTSSLLATPRVMNYQCFTLKTQVKFNGYPAGIYSTSSSLITPLVITFLLTPLDFFVALVLIENNVCDFDKEVLFGSYGIIKSNTFFSSLLKGTKNRGILFWQFSTIQYNWKLKIGIWAFEKSSITYFLLSQFNMVDSIWQIKHIKFLRLYSKLLFKRTSVESNCYLYDYGETLKLSNKYFFDSDIQVHDNNSIEIKSICYEFNLSKLQIKFSDFFDFDCFQ